MSVLGSCFAFRSGLKQKSKTEVWFGTAWARLCSGAPCSGVGQAGVRATPSLRGGWGCSAWSWGAVGCLTWSQAKAGRPRGQRGASAPAAGRSVPAVGLGAAALGAVSPVGLLSVREPPPPDASPWPGPEALRLGRLLVSPQPPDGPVTAE